MKILIIGFAKVKYMPYLKLYTDMFHGNDIRLVFWDRDNLPDSPAPVGVKTSVFRSALADNNNKYKKLISFIQFRRFMLDVLKIKYDKIIVLTTLPAIILYRTLTNEYKGRYVFDIRDITHESFKPFALLVQNLIRQSAFSLISSKAFADVIYKSAHPDEKLHVTHNVTVDSLEHCRKPKKSDFPLDIVYWGMIRDTEVNKAIIKSLRNDNRFRLHFYGREQLEAVELKAFAAETGCENVFFHGEYDPKDKEKLFDEAHIIHNIYGEKATLAIGNKYYDGIVAGIPQLCAEGSVMGNLAEKNGIGISVNPFSENLADTIADYYQSIDFAAFEKSCLEQSRQLCEELKTVNQLLKSASGI